MSVLLDKLKAIGRLISVALLLIAVVGTGQTQSPAPAQDDDVIRTETNLTNLLFTATDKKNRYINTLQETDVRVLEDGVPQKVFTFQRETDRPLSLAFLIDVSKSQENTLPQEKDAARAFIENVIRTGKDQAAIIPFSGYAHLEQPLTRNVFDLYRAVERIEVADPAYMGSAPPISGIISGPGTVGPPVETQTSIWDSVYLTSRRVLAADREQYRRAIILLTDGQDTSSRVPRSAAIEHAIATETVIYAIGIGDKENYLGIDKDVLREVAERTGGRAFFPKKEKDLVAAFAEIGTELRSQYLLAYSSTNRNRDGAFRTMTIEIANPGLSKQGLKLRYRPGYFAKRAGN